MGESLEQDKEKQPRRIGGLTNQTMKKLFLILIANAVVVTYLIFASLNHIKTSEFLFDL